jgi:hypothetical protein
MKAITVVRGAVNGLLGSLCIHFYSFYPGLFLAIVAGLAFNGFTSLCEIYHVLTRIRQWKWYLMERRAEWVTLQKDLRVRLIRLKGPFFEQIVTPCKVLTSSEGMRSDFILGASAKAENLRKLSCLHVNAQNDDVYLVLSRFVSDGSTLRVMANKGISAAFNSTMLIIYGNNAYSPHGTGREATEKIFTALRNGESPAVYALLES